MLFTTRVSQKSESVVVICGGPSAYEHKDFILDYIRRNKSIVISANKDYYDEIESHYVCIKDAKVIYRLKGVRSRNIIILKRCTRALKRVSSKKRKIKTFFSVCPKNAPTGAYDAGTNLCIKNGSLYVNNLGGSGFMAIAVSCLCLPKKVLIAGMDGWSGTNGNKTYKINSKGEKIVVNWGPNYWDRRIKVKAKYLSSVLLPFLQRRKIKLQSFRSCGLWGSDRSGITDLA